MRKYLRAAPTSKCTCAESAVLKCLHTGEEVVSAKPMEQSQILPKGVQPGHISEVENDKGQGSYYGCYGHYRVG